MELHRVATATMSFFWFTEAARIDRRVPFAESMDAIQSAASGSQTITLYGVSRSEAVRESEGSVHVTPDG